MNNEKISKNTQAESLSLGIVLVISGIFLPIFFQFSLTTVWITTSLIGVGIAAIGLEAEKTIYGKGFSSIGVGALFFLFGFLSLFSFTNIILRILGFIIIIIGLFGGITGIIENIKAKSQNKSTSVKQSKESIKKVAWGTIVTITGFIADILAIAALFSEFN